MTAQQAIKPMLPVILGHELLGYIPYKGKEASFYDLLEGGLEGKNGVQVTLQDIPGNAGLNSYYLAVGNRDKAIKAIHDIGQLNPFLTVKGKKQ